MKKAAVLLAAVIFIIVGMTSSIVSAQTVKIAIVDLFKAINESESGKKAKTDLETAIKTKQGSLDEKGKKIETLKADLDKQAALISAEARKNKEEELERLMRDYQRVVADSQAEIKKKENELTGGILKELREIITKTAQEDGYSLVLESAESLVLYFDKSADITDKIIKKYNDSKKK
jgi:outer membrane protein